MSTERRKYLRRTGGRTTGFSVERVRVYIPFVDDFVDMTHESSVVERATRTIMEHLREFS